MVEKDLGVFKKWMSIEILELLYKSELKLEKELENKGNEVFLNLKNILPVRADFVSSIDRARTTIHDNIILMNRTMTFFNGGEKIIKKLTCNNTGKRGRPPVYYRINMKAFESLPNSVKDKVLKRVKNN